MPEIIAGHEDAKTRRKATMLQVAAAYLIAVTMSLGLSAKQKWSLPRKRVAMVLLTSVALSYLASLFLVLIAAGASDFGYLPYVLRSALRPLPILIAFLACLAGLLYGRYLSRINTWRSYFVTIPCAILLILASLLTIEKTM